jgi:hypothetical protein
MGGIDPGAIKLTEFQPAASIYHQFCNLLTLIQTYNFDRQREVSAMNLPGHCRVDGPDELPLHTALER